jgi:CxxC motif-containing protein (DUF1111 family)
MSARMVGRAACAAALALFLGVLLTPLARLDYVDPQPLGELDDEQLDRYDAGAQLFFKEFGVDDGLGPVYNGRSCVECHLSPGGGGGDDGKDHQVVVFGRSDFAGGFDPLASAGGPIRSERSVKGQLSSCDLQGEVEPKEANVKSHRQPPPLYGAGLIDSIPDEVIIKQIEKGAKKDPGEVRGKANMIDGRVGRFGWKAQYATLRQVVGQQMADQIGITNQVVGTEPAAARGAVPKACDPVKDPDDSGDDLAALTDFLTYLAPLGRGDVSSDGDHGADVFDSLGCVACHTPTLKTGSSQIPALNEKDVPLYSDLLLHDMGDLLADEVGEGQAGSTFWRTTPLWGLGERQRYLHDGRTTSLRQVIEAHAGEALAARARFRKLKSGDADDLFAFLRSL